MRIAAIDIGSNTFHLIIAEQDTNGFKTIFKINKPIKLSEDITKDNRIISTAFQRGINCLIEFKALLDKYEFQKLKAVATSAVRNATNGQEFIAKAYKLAGINIEILTGDQEASFIYQGVKASGAIKGKSLIMDIGGGSTEFIFCDENGSHWKKSFEIGAARLMQKFWKNDPITSAEKISIQNHLEKILQELIAFNQSFGAKTLVGSAGAFETFLEMTNQDVNIDLDNLRSSKIDFSQYQSLSKKIIHSTHEERAQMPHLIPLRVDMIVMATLQTNYIIEQLGIEDIHMTTYDLKYGILDSLIQ